MLLIRSIKNKILSFINMTKYKQRVREYMFLVTKFRVVQHMKFNFSQDKNIKQAIYINMFFSFSYPENRKQKATCPSEEMTAICVPSGKWATVPTDKLSEVFLLVKIINDLTRSAVRRQLLFFLIFPYFYIHMYIYIFVSFKLLQLMVLDFKNIDIIQNNFKINKTMFKTGIKGWSSVVQLFERSVGDCIVLPFRHLPGVKVYIRLTELHIHVVNLLMNNSLPLSPSNPTLCKFWV